MFSKVEGNQEINLDLTYDELSLVQNNESSYFFFKQKKSKLHVLHQNSQQEHSSITTHDFFPLEDWKIKKMYTFSYFLRNNHGREGIRTKHEFGNHGKLLD